MPQTTTQMLREKWENATFADNFLFCKILSNDPELCKEIIELLLHIEIDHLETPESEKSAKTDYNAHGVRFDVYTKGDGKIFDVELQSINEDDLPKRARYYQGVIDIENLPEGVLYKELKDSYIIFICLFDLFKKGLPVYTFENLCLEDNEIKLNDRAFKVFFNTKSCDKIKDEKQQAFFKYLTSAKADSDLTKRIAEKVARAKKNRDWWRNYMTWQQSILYEGERAKRKTRRENATNLLNMNILSPEQIAQAVSLPLEEVLALQEQVTHEATAHA